MTTPKGSDPKKADLLTLGCELEFFVPALLSNSEDPVQDDREIQKVSSAVKESDIEDGLEWVNDKNESKVPTKIEVGTDKAKNAREEGWKAIINTVIQTLNSPEVKRDLKRELKAVEYQHHAHSLTVQNNHGLPIIFSKTVVSREETAETLPCDPSNTSGHRYRRAPWGPKEYIWYAVEVGTIVRTQAKLPQMVGDVEAICKIIPSKMRVTMDNGRDQSRLAVHVHVGRNRKTSSPTEKFSLLELKKLLTLVWLVEDHMIQLYAEWRRTDYVRYNSLLRKHSNLAVHCEDAATRTKFTTVPANTNIMPSPILNHIPPQYNCGAEKVLPEGYLKGVKEARDEWLGDSLKQIFNKEVQGFDQRAIDMIWGAGSVDELTWLSASSNKGKRGGVALHALLEYNVGKEVESLKEMLPPKVLEDALKEALEAKAKKSIDAEKGVGIAREILSAKALNEVLKKAVEKVPGAEVGKSIEAKKEVTIAQKAPSEEVLQEALDEALEEKARKHIGQDKGVAIVRNVALGTIEFRYMHASLDAKDINNHIKVCERLCSIATNPNPLETTLHNASEFIRLVNKLARGDAEQEFHDLLGTGVKGPTPQKKINANFDKVQKHGKRRNDLESGDKLKEGEKEPLGWSEFLFVPSPLQN